jgi:type IV pilus assembly protein PilQ
VHDADIREVCRLLADVGHVNLVVADGVSGSVTVRFRHVPWDEALDAILASKGLVARRMGSVVIVSAR